MRQSRQCCEREGTEAAISLVETTDARILAHRIKLYQVNIYKFLPREGYEVLRLASVCMFANFAWPFTYLNKSSAIAEKDDRCVGFLTRRHRFRKIAYPFPHSKFADYQSPRRNIGVRLSLLSTVKTSLRISHLLENLKTANQKVMMYICNYCKHFSALSIEEYLTYTYT